MNDEPRPPQDSTTKRALVAEVAQVFLKLGFTAFGGPAAHIAMMRQELVTRRKWLDDKEFLELVGAANLIPGPSSTELAIYLGHRRAGVWGLILAGACFILPAMFIVTALSWAYVRFGSLPQVGGLLYGMKPVVAAIVAQAIVGLGKSTLNSYTLAVTTILVAGLSLVGIPELWLVFVPGLLFALATTRKQAVATDLRPVLLLSGFIAFLLVLSFSLASLVIQHRPYSLGSLFLVFLKVGSVLYGSGYVLLSYLNTDLVSRLGWLTRAQLLDAVAVGQFTPGPVFTTATFIGFLLGGVRGALIATVGIFLPSFLLVGLTGSKLQKLRESPVAQNFLKGVSAASIGLMAAVLLKLGQDALKDWITLALFAISLAVLLRTRVNSFWLVLAGAMVGLLRT